MECLVLIVTLIALILLFSIFSNLNHIRKETKQIMSKQTEFNEKIDTVNTGLTALGEALGSEAQQILDAIAGESVDISALDGVATRITALVETVNGLVVPPVVEEDEPVDEGDTPSGDGE